MHFTPTENSRQDLLKENVDDQCIHVTGNTVIDALQWVSSKIEIDPHLDQQLTKFPSF